MAQAPPRDGVVRLFRERGGRHGKTVTVIHGLPERGPALAARLSELKRLCGAGGTEREALGGAAAGEPTGSVVLEIQGDHRERLAEHLRTLGYRVKLAGG